MPDPADAPETEADASAGEAASRPEAGIEQLGFDDALAELQRTVAQLEAGGQPLEEALALHERGAALIEHCDRLLTSAQLRMQQLVARSSGLETVDVRNEDPPEA